MKQLVRNDLVGRCLQLDTIKDNVDEENQEYIFVQENIVEGSILEQNNFLISELVTTQGGSQPTKTNKEVTKSQEFYNGSRRFISNRGIVIS